MVLLAVDIFITVYLQQLYFMKSVQDYMKYRTPEKQIQIRL